MDGILHIGEAIRRGRRDKKMTQKDLAKVLGVSPSLVSFWENNSRGPSGQELIRIAKYLDIVHLLFPDYVVYKEASGSTNDYSIIREEISQYREETLKMKKEIQNLKKRIDAFQKDH